MAHLLRTIPDSILVRGYVTTGADLAAIDQKTFVAINGDEGGSWHPSSPIVINGVGVVIAGPWVMSTSGVNVTTSVGKDITFGKGTKGDYFGLGAGHPLASPLVRTDFDVSFSPIAQSAEWFGGLLTTAPGVRFYTPLNVFSGVGVLGDVVITWRVRESRGSNVPQYLPRVRVVAVDDEGNAIPLRSKDATTDLEGFQSLPTPASGAAYYNSASPQTWTYTCNVALPVDSSKYAYYIEFIEESGLNAWTSNGSQFYRAVAHHSLVTIFDGRN